MLPQSRRLTSKDVRYIQKVRKIAFSDHFRVQRVPQYPNRKFHQISIYIAADKIHRASWRHYVKRRLLEVLKAYNQKTEIQKYYKIFLSLNPKTIQIDPRQLDTKARKEYFDSLVEKFQRELPRLLSKVV